MKIAYLVICNSNPKHLNRLLNALASDRADFFIHIDKKSKETFDLPLSPNIYRLVNTVPVYWGGFGIVEATIRLIKEAYKSKSYDYYILLSGSDYPVRSNKYINTFLKKHLHTEFMNLCKMPQNNKTFDRIDYVYFEGSENVFVNILSRKTNHLLRKMNIKRKYPQKYAHLTLYAGSQWWALSKECVAYILKFIEQNKQYVQFYKHTFCPDEMFFHTIIGNSPYKQRVANNLTYADWESNVLPLPARITEKHMPLLAKKTIKTSYGKEESPFLFARKFFDDSTRVIDLIDKKLRV